MTSQTVRGNIDLTATGVDRLRAAEKQMDGLLSTSRVTAFNTAITAAQVGINMLAQVAQVAERGITKAVQAGLDLERSKMTWTALLRDAEAAEARVASLRTMGARTPFEFTDLQQAALQLQAIGRYSERALQAIGNTAATFNVTFAEAAQAALGVTRGELDPLERLGINKATIAKQLGVAMKDVGFQAAEDISRNWDAVLSIMEREYGGMMDRLATTGSGKLSNLSDAWNQAFAEIGKGLTDPIGEGAVTFTDKINAMIQDGSFQRAGEALGGVLSRALVVMERVLDSPIVQDLVLQSKRPGWETEQNWGDRQLAKLLDEGPSGPFGKRQKLDPIERWFFSQFASPATPRVGSSGLTPGAIAIMEAQSAGGGAFSGQQPPSDSGRPVGGTGAAPYDIAGGLSYWINNDQSKPYSRAGKSKLDALMGDFGEEAKDPWADMRDSTQSFVDFFEESMKYMDQSSREAWDGIKAGIAGTMNATAKITESFFLKEKLNHASLGSIAKYAAASAASSIIKAEADKAAIKAKFYGAEALGMVAIGNFGGAARAGLAAAAFAGLAGVGYGTASAMEQGAANDFETKQSRTQPTSDSGGRVSTGAGNPGVRVLNAGAAAQTINYSVTVIHNSGVVYGSDGLESMLREALPSVVRELRETAQI